VLAANVVIISQVLTVIILWCRFGLNRDWLTDFI